MPHQRDVSRRAICIVAKNADVGALRILIGLVPQRIGVVSNDALFFLDPNKAGACSKKRHSLYFCQPVCDGLKRPVFVYLCDKQN